MSIFEGDVESIFNRNVKSDDKVMVLGETSDVFLDKKPMDIFGKDNIGVNRSPFVSSPMVVRPGYKVVGLEKGVDKVSYSLSLDSEQQRLAEEFKKEFKKFSDDFLKILDNIKDDGFKKQNAEILVKSLEENAKQALENTETLDKYIKLSISTDKSKNQLTGTGLDYQFGFLISKGSSLNLKNPDLLFLRNQPTDIRHRKISMILSLIMNNTPQSPYRLEWNELLKLMVDNTKEEREKYSMGHWGTELNSIKYWSFYAYLLSLFDKGYLNLGDLEKEVKVNIMAEGYPEAPKKPEEQEQDKKKDKNKKGGGNKNKKKKKQEPKKPFLKERNLTYFIDKYEGSGYTQFNKEIKNLISNQKLFFNSTNHKLISLDDLQQNIYLKTGSFKDLKENLCGGSKPIDYVEDNKGEFQDGLYKSPHILTFSSLLEKRERGNELEKINEKLKQECGKDINDFYKKSYLECESFRKYFENYSLYRINPFDEPKEYQPINLRVMTGLKIYFYSLGNESRVFAETLRNRFDIQKKKEENKTNQDKNKKQENKKQENKNKENRKPENKNKEEKLRKLREGIKKAKDAIYSTKDEKKKQQLEKIKAELINKYKRLSN